MATWAELLNRRIGRMEALAYDLSQVKPGYQPTELEIDRAQALYAALGQLLGVVIPEIGTTLSAPGPAPEKPEEVKPKEAKPETKPDKAGKK